MSFATTLNGDTFKVCPGIKTKDPSFRRHVEIIKPAKGSHRKAGQIYLQTATEEGE